MRQASRGPWRPKPQTLRRWLSRLAGKGPLTLHELFDPGPNRGPTLGMLGFMELAESGWPDQPATYRITVEGRLKLHELESLEQEAA